MSTSNYKFISALLNDPKLTASDRDRIIQLISKELERKNLVTEEQLKNFVTEDKLKSYVTIDSLKELLALSKAANATNAPQQEETKSTKRGSNKHDPRRVVKFLKLFSSASSPFKYATHTWDKTSNAEFPYKTYDEFMDACSAEFGKNKDIYNYNQQIYYLVHDFLLKTDYGSYPGWGNIYPIKIGYSYPPNILKNWMDNNPEKQPFSMPLSDLPKELIPKMGRKVPNDFGDISNLFKKTIQFRNNDLYNDVKKIFTSSDFDINEELLETLKGVEFYTSTKLLKDALSIVSENIVSHAKESNNVNIYIVVSDENVSPDKFVDLCIEHIGSFSNSPITAEKIMLKNEMGQLLDIKNKLISLCDFYIESRFKIGGKMECAHIDYLKGEDITIDPSYEIIDNCKGFKYGFSFYL